MAGSDRPPTTDRNLQRDADTHRHVQGTTLGSNCTSPEYQAGDDLDALRSLRKILRAANTMLLQAATELRQAPSLSTFEFLEVINELERKDSELIKLNEEIGELPEGDEFEHDFYGVLNYQEMIS